MTRVIDTETLSKAAPSWARRFLGTDRKGRSGLRWIDGPSSVMEDLYNMHFKDEHEILLEAIRDELGQNARNRFDVMAEKALTSREDSVFEAMLAERLGQTLDGDHREGFIGRVVLGQRYICHVSAEVEAPWSIKRRKALGLPLHVSDRDDRELITKIIPYYWPIYAGEAEERELPNEGVADPFVAPANYHGVAVPRSLSAAAMGVSNQAALAAADAVVDLLDEGASTAILVGYTTARPADVDTAIGAQTKLFTLVCSDPAFNAAVDDTPGGLATADTITDDASADATGTLAFCRASASDDGAAALDDHIDGNAGTSGEDFNFNTLSIVAGAAVAVSAWTVLAPEAP